MNNKNKQFKQPAQHLIAGLCTTDDSIEFFGYPDTMTVEWLQNGKSHTFRELPIKYYRLLLNAYNSDAPAKKILRNLDTGRGTTVKLDLVRQVELYTYFMYGALDAHPDIRDGALQPCENYRHSRDCPSLQFDAKEFRLNGAKLTPRDLTMLDLWSEDLKDEVVAMELGITRATLSWHKKRLFVKTGTQTKNHVSLQAQAQGITQIPYSA